MKIVYISEFYAPTMSYVENNLPKAFAALGNEVHIIATKKSPFLNMQPRPVSDDDYVMSLKDLTYHNGVYLHFVDHNEIGGIVRMKGLNKKIDEIKPDIVQITAPYSIIPSTVFFHRLFRKYKLFSMAHHTVSSFPVAQRNPQKFDWMYLKNVIPRFINGRMISYLTEKCFAATTDCALVAYKYFGVQRHKLMLTPLCVDLQKCFPVESDNDKISRNEIRSSLGFVDSDIVLIYTGKFIPDKDPLILAKAIDKISIDYPQFKGVFIGSGPQGKDIQNCNNCKVIDFQPSDLLPSYYRAFEIGVWPRQESVSMIEAAACGIPIIVNHTLQATERIEGNGLTFIQHDMESLKSTILSLISPDERKRLGDYGVSKSRKQFSWSESAKIRMTEYSKSLR